MKSIMGCVLYLLIFNADFKWMRWQGHVAHVGDTGNAFAVGNPQVWRHADWPSHRMEGSRMMPVAAPCENSNERWRMYPVAEQLSGSKVGLMLWFLSNHFECHQRWYNCYDTWLSLHSASTLIHRHADNLPSLHCITSLIYRPHYTIICYVQTALLWLDCLLSCGRLIPTRVKIVWSPVIHS